MLYSMFSISENCPLSGNDVMLRQMYIQLVYLQKKNRTYRSFYPIRFHNCIEQKNILSDYRLKKFLYRVATYATILGTTVSL